MLTVEWTAALELLTDEEILRLAKLRRLIERGIYSEDTIEHKRLLFLEWLYQGRYIDG